MRPRRATLVIAFTALAVLIAPTTASAAPEPGGGVTTSRAKIALDTQKKGATTLTLSFSRSSGPAGAPAPQAAAPPAVINCTATSDHPHNSTHVPGTINVIGRAQCTSTVATIDLVVGLMRDNTVVAAEPRVENQVASTSRRAAAPCVPGTYIGVADAFIVPPPGYSPAFAWLVGTSPGVPLTC